MTRQPALLFLLLTAPWRTAAQTVAPAPTPNPFNTMDCSVYSGCMDCVGAGCAWGIGTCFSSCAELPELSCYSVDFGGFSNTAAEVCALQQAEAIDAATCGIQTSCEDCTTTQLKAQQLESRQDSAGATCSWYEDRKTCSNLVCDSVGCSSPYCPSSPQGQCYFQADNCNDCLEITSQSCSWSGGSCELYCPQDTACYSPASFEFAASSTQEICQIASNDEANTALCVAQLDCASCTQAVQTDGSPCGWYFDTATATGWCGTGGCDSTGVCAVTSCQGVPTTNANVQCSALQGLDPEDLTCQACLEADCGWTTNGQCLGDCSFTADGSCFTVEEFDTVQGVCNEVDTAIADAAACGMATSQGCDVCVSTLKSDRRSTCQWYEASTTGAAYCGVGGTDAQGNGGSLICSDDPAGGSGICGSLLTCSSCLNSDPCAWDGSACYANCDALPFGATCYSPNNQDQFQFQSNFAICNQAEADTGASGVQQNSAQTPAPTSGATRRSSLVVVVVTMIMAATALA